MINTPLNQKLRGLYAITDPELLPEETLVASVEQAILGGASIIQYRDKHATEVELIRRAESLASCCKTYQTPLIINDRIDICKRVNADGVHLGQEDNAVKAAREQLGSAAIIGATCHNSIDLAEQALTEGASYVAFGRFFNSHSKQHAPPADLSILKEAELRIRLPKVAIGGINLDNGQSVLEHGADMIAVIHALFASGNVSINDIAKKAAAFQTLFNH
ncbi:thiamine phosphate synthase [Alkalimarinus sediminis]|uniref:Thiamine-phosphate synthase n=1 Tax=Alkalimarinus sediminis TaxID=1632866 RepID=A0A9E8HJ89_9ALTE|nr:thiamine phosphate synthase [Alkalimarinus sediminis]UZW75370.1 thiamine phosphate synthase [Alkalimarinus sediminis]